MNKPTFKIIIAGSRHFDNYPELKRVCDYYLSEKRHTHEIEIVSGGCYGADLMGEAYARENGFKIEPFPASWKLYGPSAGPIRNEDMARYADALIAFNIPRDKRTGTEDMIDRARHYGLKVIIKTYRLV